MFVWSQTNKFNHTTLPLGFTVKFACTEITPMTLIAWHSYNPSFSSRACKILNAPDGSTTCLPSEGNRDPSLCQAIAGWGKPVALQSNEAVSPSNTVWSSGLWMKVGAAKNFNKTKITNLCG